MGLLGYGAHGAANLTFVNSINEAFRLNGRHNLDFRVKHFSVRIFILSLVRLELFESLTKRCV